MTVIPFSNVALRDVKTPFVAFEHPFQDRAGRFERQVDAMRLNTSVILFTDTWPDAFHDPFVSGRTRDALMAYGLPQKRYAHCLWPETALYQTDVARLFVVDETIKYRPHVHFFCQYWSACSEALRTADDVDLSMEAGICVPDRNIYAVDYPAPRLSKEKCQLSVIVLIERGNTFKIRRSDFPYGAEIIIVNCTTTNVDTDGLAVIDCSMMPTGAAFNVAVAEAHGKFIAIHKAGNTTGQRFDVQMSDDVDLSIVPIRNGDKLEGWSSFGFTQLTDVPNGQAGGLMFSRRSLSTYSAQPTMHAGFDYDLYLRIVADQSMSLAYHDDICIDGPVYTNPYGTLYTQQVYNDAANRLRYGKVYHAWAIRPGPVDVGLRPGT